jgi:hypothetical protein
MVSLMIIFNHIKLIVLEHMESYNKKKIRPEPIMRKSAMSKKNAGAQQKDIPSENNGMWTGFLAKLGCINRNGA